MDIRKSTRREFIAAGGAAALVAIQPAPAAVFTPAERETLIAAMDRIIPAADGMPSASEAGCLTYLERALPEVEGVLDQFREALARLGGEATVEDLQALERNSPGLFATLRDFVYEAYYTRPEVWSRIGYELYPTDHTGPELGAFDPATLDNVRRRGKFYVEVD